MSGDPVLRVIAFLLPRAARAWYLEEWRSDSQAAAEAGYGVEMCCSGRQC